MGNPESATELNVSLAPTNKVWGKVIFSQVSIILFMGLRPVGVSLQLSLCPRVSVQGSLCQGSLSEGPLSEDLCPGGPGDLCQEVSVTETPLPVTVDGQAVCILLEYYLVIIFVNIKFCT